MHEIVTRMPVLICGGLGIVATYRFLRYRPVLKKGFKKKLVAVVLLSGVLCSSFCGISYLNTHKSWSYSLKYTYEEASKGMCPNGTLLNISDIICSDVLEDVSAKMGLSTNELSGCLRVSSAMDNTSLDTKNPKIATDYSVSCTSKAYSYDTEKMIRAAADAYMEYFMKNCAEQTVPLEIDLSDMDELEYQDKVKRVSIEAEKLKNYLSGYKWDNQGYENGTPDTFSSLVQKVDDFINVELEKTQAYITENGIAKDSDAFKTTTEYKNILLKKDYDKNMASYNVCLDAIEQYDSSMVSVVLVPTQDEDENFYMSRTKIGVDYFATDASSYSDQAASYKQDMSDNSYMLEKVTDSDPEKIQKADSMIEGLKTELTSISDSAQTFFKGFLDDKRDGYMKVVFRQVTPIQALDPKGNIKYTFICGICLLVVAFCKKEKNIEKSDHTV